MSLRDLYTDVILDHYKRPRNKRAVENATHAVKGHNPLCGDKLDLYIRLEGGIIADVGFTGQGCAIHTASTSMLTERVMGKPLAKVKELIDAFLAMLVESGEADEEKLGELIVLQGVRELHARIKCATLSWHTLDVALFGGGVEERTDTEGLEVGA